MTKTYKILDNEGNSQKGFVLIVAILAVMILTAVGIFALTTSSSDIGISVRSVSEVNALSAAETGVHILCRDIIFPAATGAIALPDIPKTNIMSPENTSNSSYAVARQTTGTPLPAYGSSITLPSESVHNTLDAQVTGYDERLNGRVTLSVGILNPIATPGGPGGP